MIYDHECTLTAARLINQLARKWQMLPLILLLTMTGCGLKTDPRIDANKVNSEIKNRKPVRIFDSDRNTAATGLSTYLTTDAENVVAKFSDICSVSLDSIKLEKIWEPLMLEVQVICDDAQGLSVKEKEIWDSYTNAHVSGSTTSSNMHRLPNSEWLISVPKVQGDSLTLLYVKMTKPGLSKWVYQVKTRQIVPPYEVK